MAEEEAPTLKIERSSVAPTGVDATAVEALRVQEAARAVAFGRAVAILCAAGLLFQLAYRGHPLLHVGTAIAQATLGAFGFWISIRARDPARYTHAVGRLFGITAAVSALVWVQYLGVFSPVTVTFVVGLSFFGQVDDPKVVMPIGLATIASYLVIAMLVAFGVLPDLGVFTAAGTPLAARLAMLLMVTAVMFVQLWHARVTRRATLEAIERSNRAVRLARTREAQLEEAQQNLDAAIAAGLRAGRHTGTLAGRYRLEHVVGRGAMGEVYAARVEPGGEHAAVKLLRLGGLEESELVHRFLREGDIALRVHAPNLVRVLEVGRTEEGAPFLAMELLEGTDLGALLRERVALPLDEVVTLVEDACRGLSALHEAGVVHRDLKPQNLFLSVRPPCWKILDYGVSKLRDGSGTLTEGQLVGTPTYMAPEQAQGRAVDPRADLFALGAVAYRALTGRRPFSGPDTPQILYQVVFGAPVRPRDLAPELPRDVELALAVALAKDPEDRFASAADMSAAVRAAASSSLAPALRARAERILRASPWAPASVDAQAGREAAGPIVPR